MLEAARRARRDLWLVVALVPVIMAVMLVAQFNGVVTPPNSQFFIDPPDPELEAQLKAEELAQWRAALPAQLPAFAFPASLLEVAGNIGPLVLLSIYVGTALVGGEFEWGTVRTIHLLARRLATMAVRVAFVVGLVAIAAAIALVLGSILPFVLVADGRPLQEYAQPVPDLPGRAVGRLITVLPFIAVPILMAVLARASGLAFLLTLLVFVADVAITGMPIWSSSPVPWLPALTITGSVGRLLGGEQSALASLVPAGVSVAAVLAWFILPVTAALAWFRRIDLND